MMPDTHFPIVAQWGMTHPGIEAPMIPLPLIDLATLKPVVRAMAGSSVIAALIQAVSPPMDGTLDRVAHLGATSILALGCAVLWRAWAADRKTLLEMYRTNAEERAESQALLAKMSDTLASTQALLGKMAHTLAAIKESAPARSGR